MMKFKYESPKIVNLSGEQTAQGATCSYGSHADNCCASTGNLATSYCYTGTSRSAYGSCCAGTCGVVPTCCTGYCDGISPCCGYGEQNSGYCNYGNCTGYNCCPGPCDTARGNGCYSGYGCGGGNLAQR
jgi:hypothetical protein